MSRLSHPAPPVDQLDSAGFIARSVLHALPVAHVSSPLACSRATAAGARCTCSWLGRRRSMTVRSRPRMPEVALEPGELGPGGGAVLLGQLDVDAVVDAQVPAPAADADGSRRRAGELRLARQHVQERAGIFRRIRPDDHEQVGEALDGRVGDDAAVAAQQMQPLLLLPERQRRGLGDAHIERVRQAPLDRRRRHPRQRQQPRARRLEVDAEDRLAQLHADGREDLRGGRLVAAIGEHALDREAELGRGRDERAVEAGELTIDPAVRRPARRRRPPASAIAAATPPQITARRRPRGHGLRRVGLRAPPLRAGARVTTERIAAIRRRIARSPPSNRRARETRCRGTWPARAPATAASCRAAYSLRADKADSARRLPCRRSGSRNG